MRKKIFMLLVAALSFGVANAQDGGKKEHVIKDVKATKMAGARGKDKIKNDVPTTDVAAPKAAERGSASECHLTFDNYTGYWVKVYVDGNFKGYVEPWKTGEVYVYGGWTSWYCETAGGTLYWENSGDCYSDWWVNLRD